MAIMGIVNPRGLTVDITDGMIRMSAVAETVHQVDPPFILLNIFRDLLLPNSLISGWELGAASSVFVVEIEFRLTIPSSYLTHPASAHSHQRETRSKVNEDESG